MSVEIPPHWSFTKLNGKVPIKTGWQNAEHVHWDVASKWKCNVGLRTGLASRIVGIDIDPDKGGEIPAWLEDSVCVKTGGGGFHYYFEYDKKIRNSAGKDGWAFPLLGLGVDVRGDGGQLVFPGSKHPETGEIYSWIHGPGDFPVTWLQQQIINTHDRPPLSPYAQRALDEELDKLGKAPIGTRNATLNTCTFKLSTLSAAGEIPQGPVLVRLKEKALAIGLGDKEADATIASGWKAGQAHPRKVRPISPERLEATILIPGEHFEGDGNEPVQQGANDFCNGVLCALPEGVLYRRERIVGELDGASGKMQFAQMNQNRGRILIDRHVRLAKWTKGSTASTKPTDLATLIFLA